MLATKAAEFGKERVRAQALFHFIFLTRKFITISLPASMQLRIVKEKDT